MFSVKEFMRIGKFLSRAGICSRREAAAFISAHEVTYDGQRILRPDFDVPDRGTLNIDGKEHSLLLESQIILFHKPPGYVCSHKEQKNKKSIFRLLPPEMASYFFAGRLDEDSRGLMVLSNDGDIIYELTHPSRNVSKIYEIVTSRPLSEDEQAKMISGIYERGEKLQADKVIRGKKPAHYTVKLHSGKNRVIRRMVGFFKASVTDLLRTQLGDYSLGDIQEGSWVLSGKKENLQSHNKVLKRMHD